MKTGPSAAPAPRRGDYGFDAPYVPILLGIGGLAMLSFSGLSVAAGAGPWAAAPLLSGLFLLVSACSYVYTTRVGKFAVWAELLEGLDLRGDERLLDLGCGRGAVLVMAAARLPRGRAVGIDLWKRSDQSGNSADATRANAAREGVADRVELHTGDVRSLPFDDATFDVVVSSLALHNIPEPVGRGRAVAEAARVLKPGGRLALADFRATGEYTARLRALGMRDVRERALGWRFWYGGPWAATSVVTATKPT